MNAAVEDRNRDESVEQPDDARSKVHVSIGEMMGLIAIFALVFTACRIDWLVAALVGLTTSPAFARTVIQLRSERRTGWVDGPWDALGLFVCWIWVCVWDLFWLGLALVAVLIVTVPLQLLVFNSVDGLLFASSAIAFVFVCIYLRRILSRASISDLE